MTREDAKKLIMIVTYSFPNFKPADLTMAVNVWADLLSDYSYEQAAAGLKAYITTDTSGFAPSVGQIIDKIHSLKPTHRELNSNEAWALVYKALSNSTYHAEEEFEKLPPSVQRAVGSADNLRSLAGSSDFNEEVEKSLFRRTYEITVARMKEDAKLPQSIKELIASSQMQIGVSDE